MFYQTNRFFKVISTEYPAHLYQMTKACLMADSIMLPEKPTGKMKALYHELTGEIVRLAKSNVGFNASEYVHKLTEIFGNGIRKGDQFYINHAGCKSPFGQNVEWHLKSWDNRVNQVISTQAISDLFPLLLDLEIIAPANTMNSTIAQIAWSGIRAVCGQPFAYIPISEILIYRSAIKTRRSEHEAHFNFQQNFKN